MTTKSREFDNEIFKTHKSRSIKFAPLQNSGFTLIELLVVISIIALLSTIVFGALQDSRVKARNTAKNSLVLEYIKALEMYRDDNGKYPSAGEGIEKTPKCVGFKEDEKCFADAYTGSIAINNAFSKYISGDFSHKLPVMNDSSNFNGIQYVCKENDCVSYQLIWALDKKNTDCILNSVQIDGFGENTYCRYPI